MTIVFDHRLYRIRQTMTGVVILEESHDVGEYREIYRKFHDRLYTQGELYRLGKELVKGRRT